MVDAAHNGRAQEGMPALHTTRGGSGGELADERTVGLQVTQEVVKVLANATPRLKGSRNNLQTSNGGVAFQLLSFSMLACHTIHRGGLGILASLLWVPRGGVNEKRRGTRCSGHYVHDSFFSDRWA